MLSDKADKIFKLKYALTLSNGKKEDWGNAAARIAQYVAEPEQNNGDRLQFIADSTKAIYEKSFIPGGRVIANAGTGIKNLMNCFVLPIEDSRVSIYETLKNAAEIFAWGGGIGYNFSKLRHEGASVVTTGGKASGPVSFMELFDTTGEVISQASRRGAQMGMLNVEHPDILKFIHYKNKLNPRNERIYDSFLGPSTGEDVSKRLFKVLADSQLSHFNISVVLSDSFMLAVTQNSDWNLVSPVDGSIVETLPARDILLAIAENAWKNGDPGVYFIDRANEYSLVPYLGSLDATNPCGEVPLLAYEPCCLGSINLKNFVEDDFIDFDYLTHIVKLAVRFLDNVQEISETPISEINRVSKLTRRLGLGVMGFADMLTEMKIPYNTQDAIILAGIVGKHIQRVAWKESMTLANERGAFPAFYPEKINWKILDQLELPHKPVRNVAVTSIAPTGSIALLADINNGIEPFFSKKYKRNITEGVGNVAKDSMIVEANGDIVSAHDVSWRDHIKMQAKWQQWTDNAVSKTINMSNNATVDDIANAINYAWESQCKGVTIYRDKSRNFQILET